MDTNRHIRGTSPTSRHSFAAFQTAFKDLPVIPLSEIRLRFPDMHRSRLSQWQQRGLLQKIRNGSYRISERPMNDGERWAIANGIYTPSYISLRSALGYFGFIPEGVFHVESITTNHTKLFHCQGTDYSYRNLRPDLFFGYQFVEHGDVRIRMAKPEKALLDLLYLEPKLRKAEDFEALRLDATGILARIDPLRMNDFAQLMGSKALSARYEQLKTWLHDHT